MAEYMIVDSARHLVPLGDLDPVQNISLSDAGLTPYHAIKISLEELVPGSIAVVIGAGSPSHVAMWPSRYYVPSPQPSSWLWISMRKVGLA